MANDGKELREALKNKEDVKRMVKTLYHAIPMREAVQLSKRVDYFRGRKLVDLLVEDKASDSKSMGKKSSNVLPLCSTEADAIAIGEALLRHGFIHASRVKNKAKRELEPIRSFEFTKEGYYTWIYQASSFKRNLLLGLIIFGFLSLVMFPIWPKPLKIGTWYLSVTFLLVFSLLVIIRGILYLILWMVGIEFWIFPNLFDDDATIVESFIPLYSFEFGESSTEAWLSRLFGLGVSIACGIWVYNQPTEFDEIMVIQKQFVSDLYEGKLLSDESHKTAEQLDRIVPDLEELQKQLEEEELDENEELDALFENLQAQDEAAEKKREDL